MRTWIDIASLAYTKNINGGLVARSAAGLPFLLSEGMEVALVPPVLDAPRWVAVESLQMRGESDAVVFFEEVPDVATAELLVGCHCLVRRAEVEDKLAELESDLPSWEGWSVFDAREGFVGKVLDIEDRPLQPLLIVEREDGGEVLIPLVEDFIVSIDEDASRIDMRLPAGLLDM